MDEENIISKTQNYCQELFQCSIQGTHVLLRPKQRNTTIQVCMTGGAGMNRTNHPRHPDRKNEQSVKTVILAKWDVKPIAPRHN